MVINKIRQQKSFADKKSAKPFFFVMLSTLESQLKLKLCTLLFILNVPTEVPPE